jgi:transposase
MPNKPIKMHKLRTIIRLYEGGSALKSISSMSCTSCNTVKKYIKIWNELKMSYQEFQQSSDAALEKLFCVATQTKAVNPRREELETRLPAICRELGKKGMTTLKQWEKYITEQPSGYGLTPFRISVQRYRTISNPLMRMEHKAGDKLFIDYCGDKLWIYPPGESPRQVEVFVSILGYSLLTYVEATVSQSKEDLITACEHAFYYFGGVPQALVPDNLKRERSKQAWSLRGGNQ